jgi:ssDNA-binding Zn-finger/Zn-ribbon topoisomerase 1
MSNKLIKSKEELKPCPFCGHKANTTYGVMGGITMIVCGNYNGCGATVSFDCGFANKQGEVASIRLWNSRKG